MFQGFERARATLSATDIAYVVGGAGPPVLLLHGYPQTHVAWAEVASLLAERLTLVVPDLRGYGDSGAPPPDPNHFAYSKRAMGQDMAELMTGLGFEQFAIGGHDRGGRVAFRMALDYRDRVTKLATLDIVPILDKTEAIDGDLAFESYHWFFLAQPAPLPETLINHDPDFYLRHTVRSWSGTSDELDPHAMSEYLRCFRKPSVVRAACEDYRAGLTIDLEHDREDRAAGRRIECPVLVLHQRGKAEGGLDELLDWWRRWADDVRGQVLNAGHFLMEEAPQETADALLDFFV